MLSARGTRLQSPDGDHFSKQKRDSQCLKELFTSCAQILSGSDGGRPRRLGVLTDTQACNKFRRKPSSRGNWDMPSGRGHMAGGSEVADVVQQGCFPEGEPRSCFKNLGRQSRSDWDVLHVQCWQLSSQPLPVCMYSTGNPASNNIHPGRNALLLLCGYSI